MSKPLSIDNLHTPEDYEYYRDSDSVADKKRFDDYKDYIISLINDDNLADLKTLLDKGYNINTELEIIREVIINHKYEVLKFLFDNGLEFSNFLDILYDFFDEGPGLIPDDELRDAIFEPNMLLFLLDELHLDPNYEGGILLLDRVTLFENEGLKILLDHGGDANTIWADDSLLMHALTTEYAFETDDTLKTIELLLDAGANPDFYSETYNQTPTTEVIDSYSINLDFIELFLKYGGHPSEKQLENTTSNELDHLYDKYNLYKMVKFSGKQS